MGTEKPPLPPRIMPNEYPPVRSTTGGELSTDIQRSVKTSSGVKITPPLLQKSISLGTDKKSITAHLAPRKSQGLIEGVEILPMHGPGQVDDFDFMRRTPSCRSILQDQGGSEQRWKGLGSHGASHISTDKGPSTAMGDLLGEVIGDDLQWKPLSPN